VIAFAADANRMAALPPKAWGWFTLLLGALLLLAAIAYAFDNGDLVDVLLSIGVWSWRRFGGSGSSFCSAGRRLNAGERI